MFKEVKKISSDPNKIKNQIRLNTIAKNGRTDRTETCFRGSSRQTQEEYMKSVEKAKTRALRFY